MGKRSNYERIERDFYPTPYEAVEPLIPHLPTKFDFIEPCAGNMALALHLCKHGGFPTIMCDIEPQHVDVIKRDAFDISLDDLTSTIEPEYIITNPPWSREILHPMIDHFREIAATWLLFDADWMHTRQASPYLPYCRKILSIGRVSWMGNGISGMDNCCWYEFVNYKVTTEFIGRDSKPESYRCKDTPDMFTDIQK